jgi:cold shock CspA family protein
MEEGFIESLEKAETSGYIWCTNKKTKVFFYASQISPRDRSNIKIGDKVQFRLKESRGEFQGFDINILDANHYIEEDGQRVFGFIKAILLGKGYGFIKILDHGPDVFFHKSSLKNISIDMLSESMYIEFELHRTSKGREARKIETTSSH